jgi:hypothetical protein
MSKGTRHSDQIRDKLPTPFNPGLDQNLIRDRARVGGADGPKQDKRHYARERVKCGL